MAFPIVIPAVGSQLLLSIYAKLSKEEVNYTCPDYFKPDVTVVIPAKNEAKRLPYALASLDSQTYELGKVVVVDDGSEDETYEVAKMMKEITDLDLEVIRREKSIGKTPSIKEVARKYNSDNLFVLDADTILEDDYIEKVRVPHYSDKVASSYGIVKSLTKQFKKKYYKEKVEPLFLNSNIDTEKYSENLLFDADEKDGFVENLKYYSSKWPVIKFRDGLYAIDQYFTKDSYLRLFDTTLFPIGCGVLYNRDKLKDVFDEFESSLGDNLTTSEDIFIGFAFCDKGLRNIQVKDAHMVSTEPKITKLPKQSALWGSSFLQSAYYFGDLSKSFRKKKSNPDKKNSKEPLGWCIFPPLIEKLSYPTSIIALSLIVPRWAAATIGIEYAAYAATSYLSTPKKDRKGLASSILVSEPIRLASLPIDLYIVGKFGLDLMRGKKDWRK